MPAGVRALAALGVTLPARSLPLRGIRYLSDGVVAEAARLLSLQRTTLIEKMRKHGLKAA